MQIDESDDVETGASEAALNPADAAAIVDASTSRKERAAQQDQSNLPTWNRQEPSGLPVQRRGRAMTTEARAKLAEMVTDLKKQVTESGANIDELDDYDLGEAEPAKKLAGEPKVEAKPVAQQPNHATEQQQGGTPAPVVPPAPSLDPQILDKRRALDERETAMNARELALNERDAGGDVQRLYDAYGEQPVATVMDFVKRSLGLEKDEDVKAEMAELVSAISGDVLGVQLPDSVKAAMEAKRTKAIVKNHEKRLTQREQEIERKRVVAEQAASKTQAIQMLTHTIHADDGRKQFAWLSREANPGEIVADVIEAQMRKDGANASPMAWHDAAKRADEYLKNNASAYYAARKDLFENGQPAVPVKPTETAAVKPVVPQGDPAGIKGSRTLTNEAASQTSAAPPQTGRSAPVVQDAEPGRRRGWSNDRHRAGTRHKLREAFRSAGQQEE